MNSAARSCASAARAGRGQKSAPWRHPFVAAHGPVRSFLAKQGIDAICVHRIGPAAANIARLAQQGKVDLVMMGTQGRGAIDGVLLGSVATKVLSQCCAPVLLIR
ncbi:MAG: universal stress protein [Rubrivivax sp.]|nr:universal stress protein [Rubrivivax sp.]